MSKKYRFETLCLHSCNNSDLFGDSTAPPLHRTSAFIFKNTKHAADLFALKKSGNIYSRINSPTQQILEEKLASLEGGAAALAFSSGTAAIHYTIINICSTGDEIIAAKNLYGGTYTMFDGILPQFGITVKFVNQNDPNNFEKAITSETRGIYIEAIGNPSLDFTDIEAVAGIARKHNLPLIVDATFASPYLLQSIEYGADIVLHSLSKWIGGHGTAIGGAVIDAGKFNWKDPKFTLYNKPDPSYHDVRYGHDFKEQDCPAFSIRMRLVPLRNLGACISPDNAWIFLQGLETLSIRMERHCQNAFETAKYLKKHHSVKWVRYPGLKDDPSYPIASRYLKKGSGGMVVFGIKGGEKAGARFIDNLKLFSHAANVGDAKSLAIHPATSTHAQLSPKQRKEGGVGDDLVRLSIGIEHIDDIIKDIKQALEKI
ncbi:MAG: O-acetylhomoserine aminocarboxypropyltransferase/cysteine synthase [Deltaproteobacteria bacterium]|nr:O-acetylhomoserine aminocarboxypropyltransferase/cysteine synthase [Deltaproteobacteria bacterium]